MGVMAMVLDYGLNCAAIASFIFIGGSRRHFRLGNEILQVDYMATTVQRPMSMIDHGSSLNTFRKLS